MGKFSNNWKRRNGNFLGFRSIIDIVCALEILGVVLFLVAPQFVMNYLILNPAAILHGQIWRIVTLHPDQNEHHFYLTFHQSYQSPSIS